MKKELLSTLMCLTSFASLTPFVSTALADEITSDVSEGRGHQTTVYYRVCLSYDSQRQQVSGCNQKRDCPSRPPRGGALPPPVQIDTGACPYSSVEVLSTVDVMDCPCAVPL